MIFWIGFIIMFLNEGFVMMRHVSPWFAKQRDNLIEKYGDGWQTFHGIVDYVWVIVVAWGLHFHLTEVVIYTSFSFFGVVHLP